MKSLRHGLKLLPYRPVRVCFHKEYFIQNMALTKALYFSKIFYHTKFQVKWYCCPSQLISHIRHVGIIRHGGEEDNSDGVMFVLVAHFV
jgi:hypothetical protein